MDNGFDQAYPIPGTNLWAVGQGMTKRELFAAMAMQGIFSGAYDCCTSDKCNENVAKQAVEVADALLAELAKGGE